MDRIAALTAKTMVNRNHIRNRLILVFASGPQISRENNGLIGAVIH
jgi:hypothetical protein